MERDTYYLASADVARRAGVINPRYRVDDGRFVLSAADLRRLQFKMTPEEFVTGLDVTIVPYDEALQLIAANHNSMGEAPVPEPVIVDVAEDETEDDGQEPDGAGEGDGQDQEENPSDEEENTSDQEDNNEQKEEEE